MSCQMGLVSQAKSCSLKGAIISLPSYTIKSNGGGQDQELSFSRLTDCSNSELRRSSRHRCIKVGIAHVITSLDIVEGNSQNGVESPRFSLGRKKHCCWFLNKVGAFQSRYETSSLSNTPFTNPSHLHYYQTDPWLPASTPGFP